MTVALPRARWLLPVAGVLAALPALFAAGPVTVLPILLAAAIVGLVLGRDRPVTGLLAVIALAALQNALLAPLSAQLSSGALLALLLAKEALAGGALVSGAALGRAGRLRLPDRLCLLYVAIVATVAAAGLAAGAIDPLEGGASSGTLASIRAALVLPFAWAVGRALAVEEGRVPSLLAGLLAIGGFVAIAGLVELVVFDGRAWALLGIGEFYEKKGLQEFLHAELRLPMNFWTFDYGRPPPRRLVGPIGEPTSAAHFLALPVALLLGARSTLPRRGTAALVLGVPLVGALLLTFGKGGVGVALLGIAAGLALRGRAVRLALLSSGLLAALALPIALASLPGLQRNVELHLSGFAHALDGLSLVGAGFGRAGNLVLAMSGDALPDRAMAVESFAAVLAVQGGLLALLAFVAFVGAAAVGLVREEPGPRAPRDVRFVLAGLLLATALASFASETPGGFIGGAPVFLVAGALLAPPRRAA